MGKVTISFVWAFIQKFGNTFLSFISNIILARLLLPEDLWCDWYDYDFYSHIKYIYRWRVWLCPDSENKSNNKGLFNHFLLEYFLLNRIIYRFVFLCSIYSIFLQITLIE